MNEKNIIKKLGELKGMSPNKDWKEKTRDFLFSEVRSSVFETEEDISTFGKILAMPKFVLSAVEERAWAVLLVIFVFVGGVFGAQAASRNARPGDSLYLARVFSERAKVAVTFDKEKKAKLDIRLASDRAKDITEVLAELSGQDKGDDKKLTKLSESFKEEIKIVKKNIKEIEQIHEVVTPSKEPALSDNFESEAFEEESFGIGFSDPDIRAVEAGKENQGLDVYIKEDSEVALINEDEKINNKDVVDATSSEKDIVTEDSVVATIVKAKTSVDDMLSSAQNSLEANDFASAKVMLETVDQMINNQQPNIEDSQVGEVKGIEETVEEDFATTSTEK
jgi:hypothetical protein